MLLLARDTEKVERRQSPRPTIQSPVENVGRVGDPDMQRGIVLIASRIPWIREAGAVSGRAAPSRDPLGEQAGQEQGQVPTLQVEEDSLFVDLPSGPRGQQAQPQRREERRRRHAWPGRAERDWSGTSGPSPSRTNPEKHSQEEE